MAEFGRRGGLKAAANRKRKSQITAATHRHSDEVISRMWWNQ